MSDTSFTLHKMIPSKTVGLFRRWGPVQPSMLYLWGTKTRRYNIRIFSSGRGICGSVDGVTFYYSCHSETGVTKYYGYEKTLIGAKKRAVRLALFGAKSVDAMTWRVLKTALRAELQLISDETTLSAIAGKDVTTWPNQP